MSIAAHDKTSGDDDNPLGDQNDPASGDRILISVEDYDAAPAISSTVQQVKRIPPTNGNARFFYNDKVENDEAVEITNNFMRILKDLLNQEIGMLRAEGAEDEANFLLSTVQNDDVLTANSGSSALRVKFLTVRFTLQLRATREISGSASIRYVYHHPRNNTIVVCDDKRYAHIFSSTAELLRADIPIHALLSKLVWSDFADTFAGFEWNKPRIHIYSETLHHYTTARTEQPVVDAMFCAATNKLYVAEQRQLSLWLFGADQQSIERVCTIPNLEYLQWTVNMAADSFYGNSQYRFFVENSASRSQRAYVVTERWILLVRVGMNYAQDYLRHAQDDESWISLSSVTWLDQPRWLVCGYVDGIIRIFDRSLTLIMTLLGNDSRIVSLALYPGTNSSLLATTEDNTMVGWCMKQRCVVDRSWLSHPSGPIVVVPSTDETSAGAFISGGKNLHYYCCDDSFQHISSLGGGLILKLANFISARLDRICCLCDDDMVRIVDPRNGNVITSALLYDRPVDVAIAPNQEIFVSTACGNLVRIDAGSNAPNPCNVLAEWQISVLVKENGDEGSSDSAPTVQTDLLLEVTKVITYRLEAFKHGRSVQTSKSMQTFSIQTDAELDLADWNDNNKNLPPPEQEKFVLVVGTRNGYLAVVDPKRGTPLNVVRGHENCAVVDLVCSDDYTAARVVSAGETDNLIRIWTCNSYGSLWPTLEMLYSLYSQVPARHLCLVDNVLMVCFCSSDVTVAEQQSLVVFDLDSRERFDHKQDVEHSVGVTALAGNKILLVFLSCAGDGTIRVWSEQNVLLRIIEMCGSIDSMVYIGQSADLCFSMRNSLFLLKQKQYLPRRYWGRLAFVPSSNQFANPDEDTSTTSTIPIDENVLNSLDEPDRERLLQMRLAPGEIPTTLDELSEFEVQKSMLTKLRVKDNLNKAKLNDDVIERVYDINNTEQLPDQSVAEANKKPPLSTKSKSHHSHHHHRHGLHSKPNKVAPVTFQSQQRKSSKQPALPPTTRTLAQNGKPPHPSPQLSPRLQQWISSNDAASTKSDSAASSYLFNVINNCLKNEALRTPQINRGNRTALMRYARRHNDLLLLFGPEPALQPSDLLSAEAGDAIWRLEHGVSPTTRDRLLPDRTRDAKLDENVLLDEEHGFFPPEQQRQLRRPAAVSDAGGTHFLAMVPNSELINRLWLHVDLLSLIYMRIARQQIPQLPTKRFQVDTRLLQYALQGGSVRRHGRTFPSPYEPFQTAIRHLHRDGTDSQLRLLKTAKSESSIADLMRADYQRKKLAAAEAAKSKQEEADREKQRLSGEPSPDEQDQKPSEDDADRGPSEGDVMEGMVQLKLLNIFGGVKRTQQQQLSQKELDERAAYEALKIVGLDEDKFARLEREMNQVYSAANSHMSSAMKREHEAALERQRAAAEAAGRVVAEKQQKEEQAAKPDPQKIDVSELMSLTEILKRTAKTAAEGEALASTTLAMGAASDERFRRASSKRKSSSAASRKSARGTSQKPVGKKLASPEEQSESTSQDVKPWTPVKQTAGAKKILPGTLALRRAADHNGNLTWQLVDISEELLPAIESATVAVAVEKENDVDGQMSVTVAATESRSQMEDSDVHMDKHKRKRMRAAKMKLEAISRQSAAEEARASARQSFLAEQRAALNPDPEVPVGAGLLGYMQGLIKNPPKPAAGLTSLTAGPVRFSDENAQSASLELNRVLKMGIKRLQSIGQTGKPAIKPQPTKRKLLQTLLQVESEAAVTDNAQQQPVKPISSNQFAQKEHQAGFITPSTFMGITTVSSITQPQRPIHGLRSPVKSATRAVVEKLVEEDEEGGSSKMVVEQESSAVGQEEIDEEEAIEESESLMQTTTEVSLISGSVHTTPVEEPKESLSAIISAQTERFHEILGAQPFQGEQPTQLDESKGFISQVSFLDNGESVTNFVKAADLQRKQSMPSTLDEAPSMFLPPLSEMTSEERLYSMPNKNRPVPKEPEPHVLSAEEIAQQNNDLINKQLQRLISTAFLTKPWFSAMGLISNPNDAEMTKIELEKLTIDQFVTRLAQNMPRMAYLHRCDAIDAVLNIDDELEFGIPDHLTTQFCRTLIDTLARVGKDNPPSAKSTFPESKSTLSFKNQETDMEIFISGALKGLHVFEDAPRPDYVTELMVNYMCGSDKLRQLAYGLLCLEGLRDPELMLTTELDEWRAHALARKSKTTSSAHLPAVKQNTPRITAAIRHSLRHKAVLFLNKWTCRYRYVKGKNEETPFDALNFFCRIKEAEARQRERFPLATFQPTKFGDEDEQEDNEEDAEEEAVAGCHRDHNAMLHVGELFFRYLYPVMRTTLRFGKQYPLKHVDVRILPDRPEVVMFKKYFYPTDSFVCAGIKSDA